MSLQPVRRLTLALLALKACSAQLPITLNVDYSTFLQRSDPVWQWNSSANMPAEWVSALFAGNAALGLYAWCDTDPSILRIDISRTTVYDDREASLGSPAFTGNFVYDQPRLPVGQLYLRLTSPLTNAVGRISLYDGMILLNLTTATGGASVAMWASADTAAADVMVVEANTTGTEIASLSWTPAVAASTWANQNSNYVYNPPASTSIVNGVNVTTQAHLMGTAHATAIRSVGAAYVITISPVLSSPAAAVSWAVGQVNGVTDLSALRAAHLAWWRAWWPQGGFITFEYTLLEQFFYINLYKFASASRVGRAVHDLMGPWFIDGTPWPDLHTDMNIEQTYYLPLLANRPDLAGGIVTYFEYLLSTGNLQKNVPVEWQSDSAGAPTGAGSLQGLETCYWNYAANCTTAPPSITGNLLWELQLVHLAAEYSGNSTIHTAVLFPLLDQALQAYQHFQLPNATGDGSIHLPTTFSPEYPGPPGPDANYDLALYRWGLSLALDLVERYNLTSPHIAAWQATLASLTWYSVDPSSNTFEIYRGTPYGTPHRHYSHLFMLWPLRTLDFTNASQHLTGKLSVDRWLATPEEDSQFYRPAASAMNVMLGQHAAAFDNITYLLHTRIEANTFYREGSQGSCTETPYAAAWAAADWMAQSWNRTVLPAVDPTRPTRLLEFYPGFDDVIVLNDSAYTAAPAKVATASFYNLGAEGGFLMSGARELVSANATHFVTRTSFIGVQSTVGGACVVRTNMARPLVAVPSSVTLTELGENLVLVGIDAGEAAAIYSSTAPPAGGLVISPADGCPADFNHYGVHAAPQPPAAGVYVNLQPCVYGSDGLVQPSQRFNYTSVSGGVLALQDGSGRCLTVSECVPSTGTRVVLAPCTAGGSGNSSAPIGCDVSSCGAATQQWFWSGPGGVPPNALQTAAAQLCMDVNGALTPDVIDLWTCDNPPGQYKNLEWAWNATSGALLTLDTAPDVIGKCITPAA